MVGAKQVGSVFVIDGVFVMVIQEFRSTMEGGTKYLEKNSAEKPSAKSINPIRAEGIIKKFIIIRQCHMFKMSS